MTKYIDAEKLKAHIQYLIKKDNYELFDVPELLSFINSLQQEQPEVDLEKEIEHFLSNATMMNKGEWKGKYPISEMGFEVVARHFYSLGLITRKV